LSSQGIEQFKAALKEVNNKLLVITISLPVIVSFAEVYNLSLDVVYKKLVTFFNTLGVRAVFDTRFAYSLIRLLLTKELNAKTTNLPLIVTECSAWLLYAIKKLHKDLLPSLSLVKSQQKLMGFLIKEVVKDKLIKEFFKDYTNEELVEENNTSGEEHKEIKEILHIAICQCNDKKVESTLDKESKKEVDLIITAKELHEYITQPFNSIKPIDTPYSITQFLPTSFPYKEITNTTLGYIYGISEQTLKFTTAGNKDFRIAEIVLSDSKKIKGVLAGGYRNIQKILASVKSGKCAHDYIEIYACPGECWGGAGLLDIEGRLADKVKTGDEDYANAALKYLNEHPTIINMLKSKPIEKKEEGVSSLSW